MTLYDVLEVRTDASPDDIRAAFRQLAKEHHPDKGGTPARMAELTHAYAVLRDPEARGLYDQSLVPGRRRRPRAAPPPDVLAPARQRGAFELFLARLTAAALGAALDEVDATVAERFVLPRGQRMPSLREILAATEDPAPPTPRRRGPATHTGR